MDNLFYTPAEQISASGIAEIGGQEAKHIAKVLRFGPGDEIHLADGAGTIYRCQIQSVQKNLVSALIKDKKHWPKPDTKKVLGFGIIKKRDRLEFAVEKAVELGAWEICLFKADHSERDRIKEERIENLVISAFKQSKRYWLPKISYAESTEEVLNRYEAFHPMVAHVESSEKASPDHLDHSNNLFMIGPEGGFSEREIELFQNQNCTFVSLGKQRLRAETAVTAFLSRYLFA